MKILVINGDPKKAGFISGALERVSSALAAQGAEVTQLRLADAKIEDCLGCFNCLKTGICSIKDDMDGMVHAMLEADGFVVGAPVRNGLMTACYKRFYERITYRLGFALKLEDKHTLALSCVGYLGGKKENKRLLGLQDVFHSRLSDYIFTTVGMPLKTNPAALQQKWEEAARKLVSDIAARPPRSLWDNLAFALDRKVMSSMMFKKHPENYAYIIESWKQKGYM